MHVARFHPPRVVGATLIAALLAVVITLVLATGATSSAGSSARVSRAPAAPLIHALLAVPPARLAVPQTTVPQTTAAGGGAAPAGATSPFAPLLTRPIMPAWAAGGRG